MTYNVFRSDDTGAPTMTGIAGTPITVLDALLVNGFNTKTITITRSGTTATATCTAHGYRDHQNLTISGANESDYNGTFVIRNCTANTFDYTVANSPATPATGTISAKVSPLGWTKEYSGTNKAAYRMAAATSGARMYLNVDASTGAVMRLRGFETMTAVDTGTGPFPTVAQMANPGLYVNVSDGVNSNPKSWFCWGTEKGFYFCTFSGNGTTGINLTPGSTAFDNGSQNNQMYFGAVKSFLPSDVYNVVIMAGSASTPNSFLGLANNLNSQGVCWIARDYTLTSSKQLSLPVWSSTNVINSGSNEAGRAQWPSLISGKIEFTTACVHSEIDAMSKYGVRCTTPGVGRCYNDAITTTRRYWDTFNDGTDYYIVVPSGVSTPWNGCIIVKLNGPDSTWNDL